jgi:hypothetical protein
VTTAGATEATVRQHFRWPTIDAAWAVIGVLVPVIVTFFTRTLAIDLAYQVRAGVQMLDSHRLLDVDPFTFTVGGQPWLNQQWGAQVLLGGAYDMAGWPAVIVLRGLLIGGIATFLYLACRARGVAPRTAALLTIVGWLSGIEIFGQLRPQLFALLLFSLCIWALATRHEHPGRIWTIPIAVIPWANLHGSFPLALLLLCFAWLEDRRTEPRLARTLIVATALSLAATFVNPYGGRVWIYIWDLSTNPIVSKQVSEWKPPTIQSWTGGFFFASLLAVAAFFARRGRPVGWIPLVELGTFVLLALQAGRGVAWWSLYVPVVIAGLIADSAHRPTTRADRSPMNVILIAAMCALTLLAIPTRFGIEPVTGGPAFMLFAPQHLLDAARPYAPPGTHVYTSQVYASWAEFSAPDLPVMVDSRIEIFPTDVWDDYFTVTNGGVGWRQVLDRWDVDVVITHPEQSEALIAAIRDDPSWQEVFYDQEGSVFVRTPPR